MTNNKSEIDNSKATEMTIDNSNIETPKPQRRKMFIKLGILAIVILLLISPFFIIDTVFKRAGIENYMEAVKSFVSSRDTSIKSQNGRVNILILGIGGKGHDGWDLTDTMIFASISLTNHSISLISIPRDIWIPDLMAKINSAYYWGETQPGRGGGLNFSKQIVSE